MLSEVSCFAEGTLQKPPYASEELVKWLVSIAQAEGQQIESLNYIFCDDEYLHKINVEYLAHDTYTDIITFDLRDEAGTPIEGDIFISVPRTEENALALGQAAEVELRRVIAHGLLHLLGYGDKTEEEAKRMRQKEDEALALWPH